MGKENVMVIIGPFRPTEIDLAGPKGWAWRLRGRELAGDQLSVVQRRFWREALASEVGA